MEFQPPRCPNRDCPSYQPGAPFSYAAHGSFQRACDGRTVPRFRCLHCGKRFSSQTFRLDYRLRNVRINRVVFGHFVSKMTLRQSARMLGCTRKTVELRLRRYGRHFRLFNAAKLVGRELEGEFQLDEAESFETDRRLKPVTIPVLIQAEHRFMVHVAVAPLPPRGRLSAAKQQRLAEQTAAEGQRVSGSREAVKTCFDVLAKATNAERHVLVSTDEKVTYPGILAESFGERPVAHHRSSSRIKRDTRNPLFHINHTLAMLRDGSSRLVRRTWAHAKLRQRLEQHLWIYVGWRNFIRGVTNKRKRETPAMAVGIEQVPWTARGILTWSADFPELLQAQ